MALSRLYCQAGIVDATAVIYATQGWMHKWLAKKLVKSSSSHHVLRLIPF